jgi:hypothetical protein
VAIRESHSFSLKERTLVPSSLTLERDTAPCSEDTVPRYVTSWREPVECITDQARLAAKPAVGSYSPVRGNTPSRNAPHNAPNLSVAL